MYFLFQGDDGAPLVYDTRLGGLFSSWTSCGTPGTYHIYTKVSALCDWIIINAGLYKISYVIDSIKPISGLQTMPRTYIATYPND